MAIKSQHFAQTQNFARQPVRPQDCGANEKLFVAQTPAAYAAQAVSETFDLCVIPAGSRILPTGSLECAAGAASSTLNIGLKKLDGTVISATQIASAVNISAAGVKAINNGAAFAGNGYIATEDVLAYATFTGATNQANQAITVYLPVTGR
jgi:hypothetical protein